VAFLVTVVSFDRYDLWGLLGMAPYLVITAIWEEISLGKGFARMKYLFFTVLMLGLANLFFDRRILFYVGHISVRGGLLSMATLFFKAVFTMYAAYFLMLTVGIDRLCVTLRGLGLPKGAITVLLLTYRYLIVLLKEAQRMLQAYALRSPRQKGIHIKAWGSFAGLLLLRSMDRAQTVYESMLLRGYDSESALTCGGAKGQGRLGVSVLYVAGWVSIFLFCRGVPVFWIVGETISGLW